MVEVVQEALGADQLPAVVVLAQLLLEVVLQLLRTPEVVAVREVLLEVRVLRVVLVDLE